MIILRTFKEISGQAVGPCGRTETEGPPAEEAEKVVA